MDRLRSFLQRFEADESITYMLVRVFLGLALFIRGTIFIADQEALMQLITTSGLDWFFPAILVHYVTLAHLVGGLMLVVGLLTRAAALSQIPILVGAVFFVHWGEGLFTAGQSLELAALVLFLLVVVFFGGSGRFSLDHYFFDKRKETNLEEAMHEEDDAGIPMDGVVKPKGRPAHPTYPSE